ncbi:hypothetical protein scyTo_0004489 [Scyliorhinus torazame]|uniref:Ig-like domain-containing protein n=1 Tax=Scyliorhinus torazame TaxID=75743 RepID=A0A401NSK9_SCYTO|nr:hypothetical protein [Scyliorhinus torazame]
MRHYCRCVSVSQIPRELTARRGDNTTLTCQQEDTDYITMLWYRQYPGHGLQLVAMDVDGNSPTFEKGLETGFQVVSSNRKRFAAVKHPLKMFVCRLWVLFLLLPDGAAVQVEQTPAHVSSSPGSRMSIKCIYTKATASSYFYWYRWHPDREPQNLFYSFGSIINPNGEVDGFTARINDNTHFYLDSSGLSANHSGVYYCAWSLHTD